MAPDFVPNHQIFLGFHFGFQIFMTPGLAGLKILTHLQPSMIMLSRIFPPLFTLVLPISVHQQHCCAKDGNFSLNRKSNEVLPQVYAPKASSTTNYLSTFHVILFCAMKYEIENSTKLSALQFPVAGSPPYPLT